MHYMKVLLILMRYYKATAPESGDYIKCSYSSVDNLNKVCKQIDYNYENIRNFVEDKYIWEIHCFYTCGWSVEEITEEEFFIHCI